MEAIYENPEKPRPHLVSILVENRPGVLARVAALFSARGYNIEGLTAAHAEGSERSRITCITMGDSQTMERIVKQLRNLVDVIGVSHGPLESSRILGREMLLVRLRRTRPDEGAPGGGPQVRGKGDLQEPGSDPPRGDRAGPQAGILSQGPGAIRGGRGGKERACGLGWP
jgi:acetolactate synthase regulatory subunit